MMIKTESADDVLKVVFKNPFVTHTITAIAKALHKTRQGVWKTVKKLEDEGLLRSEKIQKLRTSTAIIKINWESPIIVQTVSLLLTKESLLQSRWRANFEELEKHVEFLILFGSMLHSPKEANDIDILAVVKKKDFGIVEELIMNVQKTQLKKVHLIDVTKDEFDSEVKKPNNVYREAIMKGVVLYGQDTFTRYIQGVRT